MSSPITEELRDFVREKVESGAFPSEEAVIAAALRNLREQEVSTPESLLDLEFVAFCEQEGADRITLEEVRRATSTIPGSMAETIIEEERADRF